MLAFSAAFSQRISKDFNANWKFYLGDDSTLRYAIKDSSKLEKVQLPHDWSIEGAFDKDAKTKQAQGFLPAGKGWYRKAFTIPPNWKNKTVSIEFDGVFKNSEVFINGKSLGIRPNGYISFGYDLTQYLNFGKENLIAVKVDKSISGSGLGFSSSITGFSKVTVCASFIAAKIEKSISGIGFGSSSLIDGFSKVIV